MAHTKGPWRIKRKAVMMSIKCAVHQVTDEEGYPSAFVPAWMGDTPEDPSAAPEEAMANAYLIAAAPELLEELEWCVRALEYGYTGTAEDCEIPPSVHAAISKARGE